MPKKIFRKKLTARQKNRIVKKQLRRAVMSLEDRRARRALLRAEMGWMPSYANRLVR